MPRRAPKDGEFYNFFLYLSKKIPVLRDYRLAVESIPGVQEKGRYDMAMRVFQCDRRKEGV
jgi:hypothetical protein